MNLFEKIRELKFPFIAVVAALTFGGLVAPSNAAVSAVADTANAGFTIYKSMTVSGSTATTAVGAADNAGRGLVSASLLVSQADADALVGTTITVDATLVGPAGAISLDSGGFNKQLLVRHASTTVFGSGPSVSLTWPAGVNNAVTQVDFYSYINSAAFSFPTGNYTLTVALKSNGTALAFGSGITMSTATMEYKVAGLAIAAVEGTTTWESGFVCVDMTQVTAGDVLTVEAIENGTTPSNYLSTTDWYRGGNSYTTVAYNNDRAVTTQDITDGSLAVKTRASNIGTGGQALSMSVNVKKANGTDVSVSCGPTTVPGTPTLAGAGSTATLTPGSALPAGLGYSCQLINSSNAVASTMTTSTSTCMLGTNATGTFTSKVAYTRYGVAGTYSAASNSVSLTYTAPPSPCNVTATSMHATVTALTPSNSYTLYFNNDPTITNCFSNQISGFGTRSTLNGVALSTPFYSQQGSVLASGNPRTLASLLTNPNFIGRTINDGDVYTVYYYSGLSAAPTVSDTPLMSYSFTLNPNGGGQGQQVQQQVQSVVPVNTAPQFVFKSRPTVSSNGQSLTLNGANLGDVTAVKIDGKSAKINKQAAGQLVIEVPAGTIGMPTVELTHSGGTITMQGLIQVVKPFVSNRTVEITKFVGNRPTLAGIEAIEQAYLAGTSANVLTCVATVASDATAAVVATTTKRAQATCARILKYSKYIKTADILIAKDGAAGSKSVLAVTFDRTLDGK